MFYRNVWFIGILLGMVSCNTEATVTNTAQLKSISKSYHSKAIPISSYRLEFHEKGISGKYYCDYPHCKINVDFDSLKTDRWYRVKIFGFTPKIIDEVLEETSEPK